MGMIFLASTKKDLVGDCAALFTPRSVGQYWEICQQRSAQSLQTCKKLKVDSVLLGLVDLRSFAYNKSYM